MRIKTKSEGQRLMTKNFRDRASRLGLRCKILVPVVNAMQTPRTRTRKQTPLICSPVNVQVDNPAPDQPGSGTEMVV